MEEKNIKNQQSNPNFPVTTETVATPSSTGITLDQLINLAIEQEASDIHFGEGSKLAIRVEGKIVFIENIPVLSKKSTEQMIFSMLLDEDERKKLDRVREIDFSYTSSNGINFRVNVFYQRDKLSAVMRMTSKNIPTLDELGNPQEIKNFLELKEGLILVTGTAGSGKSTTIQAMLSYINDHFVHHVITIENPIEHIFEDNKSFFSQREIGKDTLTMSNGLNAAMREDPNIIMVSDINDLETLEHVLTVVESGYLVIASMSTKNARQTIERMLSMYPVSQAKQIQDRIADTLACILSQDLIDRSDQSGRVAIYELLIANNGIKNILRRGSIAQLRTAMQSGAKEGMITMDNYAEQLAEQGIVPPESVNSFAETD